MVPVSGGEVKKLLDIERRKKFRVLSSNYLSGLQEKQSGQFLKKLSSYVNIDLQSGT